MKIFHLLVLVLCSSTLFGVDVDFDGVEDDVDRCLGTSILDIVTADGCSKNQKKAFELTLLQTYSYLDVDTKSSLNNYALALMLTKESWLFYVGSGYFKYDTVNTAIDDISDTTFLIQKTLELSSNHQLKGSFSSVFPTYNSNNNEIDYGLNLAYVYSHDKMSVEASYQYDLINDENVEDVQTAYLYLGYRFTNSLNTMLGYSQDNAKRKNKIFAMQYTYTQNLNFSYNFVKGENNFYKNLHSLSMAYTF